MKNCQLVFVSVGKGARSLVRRCHTRTHAPSYVESPTYTVQHRSGTVSFLDRIWITRYMKAQLSVCSMAWFFGFSRWGEYWIHGAGDRERLAGLPYRACVSGTKSRKKHRYEIARSSSTSGLSPRKIYLPQNSLPSARGSRTSLAQLNAHTHLNAAMGDTEARTALGRHQLLGPTSFFHFCRNDRQTVRH